METWYSHHCHQLELVFFSASACSAAAVALASASLCALLSMFLALILASSSFSVVELEGMFCMSFSQQGLDDLRGLTYSDQPLLWREDLVLIL